MAQFSDLGAICKFKECKQRDFLPFVCDSCSESFCLAHRTPEAHNCPVSRNETNVVICEKCHAAIRVDSSHKTASVIAFHQKHSCKPYPVLQNCPVPGCSKKLTESGSIVCQSCKRRVCLTHRYQDSHNCIRSSIPVSPGRAHGVVADWKCIQCRTTNLGTCYRCSNCHIPRKPDSPISSPKSHPTSPRKHHKCIIS